MKKHGGKREGAGPKARDPANPVNVPVGLAVSRELLDRIDREARDQGISRSEYIRRKLESA